MDLSSLPHELKKSHFECRAVVETPKGSRNKFDYDPEFQAFTLSGVLAQGLIFPFDFGFIPSTLGGDGDPLDVMILMDEPAHPGCILQVRLIGVIEADQTEGGKKTKNDRLIGVALTSYDHQQIRSVSEINGPVIEQIGQFFVAYNKSRGKEFKITGIHGPERAMELAEQAIASFKKK